MSKYVLEHLKKQSGSRKKRTFAGSSFKRNFTGTEVVRFLGILLKISMDGRPAGGIEQYFNQSSSSYSMGKGDNLNFTEPNQDPWASQYMSLKRFKQILRAFRTEVGPNPNVKDIEKRMNYETPTKSTRPCEFKLERKSYWS